jgi:hypothetical protein
MLVAETCRLFCVGGAREETLVIRHDAWQHDTSIESWAWRPDPGTSQIRQLWTSWSQSHPPRAALREEAVTKIHPSGS